jgi:hypothetical protein
MPVGMCFRKRRHDQRSTDAGARASFLRAPARLPYQPQVTSFWLSSKPFFMVRSMTNTVARGHTILRQRAHLGTALQRAVNYRMRREVTRMFADEVRHFSHGRIYCANDHPAPPRETPGQLCGIFPMATTSADPMEPEVLKAMPRPAAIRRIVLYVAIALVAAFSEQGCLSSVAQRLPFNYG